MRTIRSAGFVVGLFAIALTASAANAMTWVSASGTQCQTNDGEILHSMWGATNPAQYSSDFVCPLPLGTQASIPRVNSLVALKYLDNNNAATFSCRVCQADSNWNSYCSQIKYTCQDYGGCYDWNTMSYTGWGLLIWNQTDLSAGVYYQDLTKNMTIRCDVAGYGSSGGNYVMSYWAND